MENSIYKLLLIHPYSPYWIHKSSIMDSWWNILPKIVDCSSKIVFKSIMMGCLFIQISSGDGYIFVLLTCRNLTFFIFFGIMSNSYN
jgi:hypothetical protein